MESINGLPAHPLFVHAPVVLVPLSALFALVLAARPGLRRKAGWGLALAAIVTLVSTQLAISSGYAFDELVAGAVNTDKHEALAITGRNFVLLFTLAALVVAVLDWRNRAGSIATTGDVTNSSASTSDTIARVGAIAAGLFSVLATVWMFRAGEEGAKLVWSGVIGFIG